MTVLVGILTLLSTTAHAADPALQPVFTPPTMGPNASSVLVLDLIADEPEPDVGFSVVLPQGLSFAPGAVPITSCDGIVEVSGNTLRFEDGRVGEPCSVSIPVTASAAATYTVTPVDFVADGTAYPTESADLDVLGGLVGFTAAFQPDTLPLGDTTRLVFTLDNTSGSAIGGASFGQSLPAGLRVAPLPNASSDCPGLLWNPQSNQDGPGQGSALPVGGADEVAMQTDLAAGSICTVGFDVLPEWAGAFPLNSSDLLYEGLSAGSATSQLQVTFAALHGIFTDDPVPPGGSATLRFALTNFDRETAATDLGFTFDLEGYFPGTTASSLPSNPCGANSSLTGAGLLTLSGGSLPAEGTCSFEVAVAIPGSATPGLHHVLTSPVSLNGPAAIWPAAEVQLIVADDGPTAVLSALTNPVAPGDTVTVRYELGNPSNAAVSELGFVQTVPALLEPSALPSSPCGLGSLLVQPPGQPTLALSGGTLAAQGSCTFEVDYLLAPIAPATSITVETGPLRALLGADSVSSSGGSTTFDVHSAPRLIVDAGPRAAAGETVTVNFTLSTGPEAVLPTDIAFTADLDAWVPGATVAGTLPVEPCGPNSTLVGGDSLTLSGGAIEPCDDCDEPFCTFAIDMAVPASTPSQVYLHESSVVTALVEGAPHTAPGAALRLEVGGVDFEASFDPSVIRPGGQVDLRFTLTNLDAFEPATGLTFDEDLDRSLEGMTVTPLSTNVCGGMLDASGSLIALAGGSLQPLESCAFTVQVLVPIDAEQGQYNYGSAALTGLIGGADITSLASAALEIAFPIQWSARVLGPAVHPTQTVTVQFEIRNADSLQALTAGAFEIDLDAAMPGLIATDLPNQPCGPGSAIVGIGDLALTGGTVPPLATCSFTVDLVVPDTAHAPGHQPVTTSVFTGFVGAFPVSATARTFGFDLLEPCRDGYRLTPDGSCEDIDECLENIDGCDTEASCTNEEGGFSCTCNAGFEGSGFDCDDIDECALELCHTGADCTNEIGDFSCVCREGFIGDGLQCLIICGDGLVLVSDGEVCDDMNNLPGDGCDETCNIEEGWFCGVPDPDEPSLCGTVCGDGVIIAPQEACDDGNQEQDDGCDAACIFEPGWACSGEPTTCDSLCGDGLVVGLEECDAGPGGTLGCTLECVIEDGYVCAGEPSICELSCGNGALDPMEGCDDGALVDGDGCDSTCQTEPGFVCIGQPSVCEESCGNGDLDPGESCDDGELVAGDGCDQLCQTEPGWDCDDEGCLPICGDGETLGDEVCDDGNTESGDGCSGDCLEEECSGSACEDTDAGTSTNSTGCQCDSRGGLPLGGIALLLGLVGLRRRS